MSKFINDFFEDLARLHDYWISHTAESLSRETSDLRWTDNLDAFKRIQLAVKAGHIADADLRAVLGDSFRGLIVSFLTCIDGGTALAEKTSLELKDKEGQSLGDDLHDGFVRHLVETNRL